MEEQWCRWIDFPEYEVSSTGKVRKGDLLLSIYKRYDGYLSVSIRRRNRLLHRVVASVWTPNPHNLPEVNHLDGNKGNCHHTNLKWVSSQENTDHKYQILGYKHPKGYNLPSGLNCPGSIPVACFKLDGTLHAVFESGSIATKSMGMAKGSIPNQVAKGWGTANGFHWKQISESKFFDLEHILDEGIPYNEKIEITRPKLHNPI